jgi:hypothetical protein
MQNGSTIGHDGSWEEMLKFFRTLGGVCENIVLGHGPRGRGLFPKDPTQPVLLRIPRALLFNLDDVEFVDGRIRLKPTANAMEAQRVFFERYEEALSWGGGGSAESADFIANLDGLPPEVRTILIEDFELRELFEGDPAARAQTRFLDSRVIRNQENLNFIMPLIELANHGSTGLNYEFDEGLQIRGKCNGEVLASYGVKDPFAIFRSFGFASPEPGAFSLPVNVNPRPPEILVQLDPSRTVKRGDTWFPQMERRNGRIELSFLIIGHARYPHLSRGIFRTLMREAGASDPDDLFDRILSFNWGKFLNLLAALEPYEGEMITTLRKVARYQLEAMSHCIGSREPEMPDAPAGPAPGQTHPAAQNWQISIQ